MNHENLIVTLQTELAEAKADWCEAVRLFGEAQAKVRELEERNKTLNDFEHSQTAKLLAKKNRLETDFKKQFLVLKAENEWLKGALAEIENWCVEFHETGPHSPEKALKIVMTIYDITHEQLEQYTGRDYAAKITKLEALVATIRDVLPYTILPGDKQKALETALAEVEGEHG